MRNSNEKKRLNLKSALSHLLYFTLFFGIVPFSGVAYFKHNTLQISLFGNIWVLSNLVNNVYQHHISSMTFILNDEQETATLSNIIGWVILYMEPVMYSIDLIGFLVYQKTLIACFDQLHEIDEKLLKHNIKIDYIKLKNLTTILLAVITVWEFILIIYNLFLFHEFTIHSIFWVSTEIPIYLSTIAKVWYVVLVYDVKQKFAAINDHFEKTRKMIHLRKKEKISKTLLKPQSLYRSNFVEDEIQLPGYLHKEILINPVKRNRNVDGISISGRIERGVTSLTGANLMVNDVVAARTNHSEFNDKIDKKLTNLSQLHNQICEIGKTINSMFSFQMLILIANGFMSITAQLFFVYCGSVGQNIPIIFRSAESLLFSVSYIVLIASRCVYIIFISWKTKINAQKTGIQIHKVANAIDEDHCYEVVNHLSLKLLNHSINFTACGFFNLDMTTLYTITGAITSYLIILIQFNLASNRKLTIDGISNGTTSNSSNT